LPITAQAALDSRVEKAIAWAVSIANDNSHGYSQSNRNGPDYDCSSFVSTAFKMGGFNVSENCWTGNMQAAFENVGFKTYAAGSVTLQRGDILLRHDNVRQHTALCLGNNQYVAAHSNYDQRTEDSSGREINVYYDTPTWHTKVLRYEGEVQQETQIEYFDCDMEIRTTKGQIVNAYRNITDTSRATYFSQGQTLYSTKGAKTSNGSIWYQVQAVNSGSVSTYWVNAGSAGVTVIDRKPDSYSIELSTDSISLSSGEKQTITIQYSWTKTPPYRIDFQFETEGTATAEWGNQSDTNVQLVVTAQQTGTAKLYIWLSDRYGGELCKKSVTVNVKPAPQVSSTPLDLDSEFYAYIYNPGLNRYITNDGGNVSSRSYNSAEPQRQIWKFTRQSDGSYFIISQLNGYDSLDVQEFGKNSGTNVRAYPSNGCTAQRWNILGTQKPGKYVLTALCTDCVVDINSNSSAEGENVQMYESNGTGAQLFQIIAAPAK